VTQKYFAFIMSYSERSEREARQASTLADRLLG
jgi:hypothetical protein